jgi:hypothetical protein
MSDVLISSFATRRTPSRGQFSGPERAQDRAEAGRLSATTASTSPGATPPAGAGRTGGVLAGSTGPRATAGASAHWRSRRHRRLVTGGSSVARGHRLGVA